MNSSSTPLFNDYGNQTLSVHVLEVISYEQLVISRKILSVLQMFFSPLGVITNIINIRVFVEQGVMKSSTNIGLLSLSVFDFMNCLLMIPSELCVIFDYSNDRYKRLICHAYVPFGVFIATMVYYCSNWTTVYLSIERVLCVVIPLQVKLILRPKATAVIVMTIVFVSGTTQMLYITSARVVWYFDLISNRTVPYLTTTNFGQRYLYVETMIMTTIGSSLAIITVSITTAAMIFKLKKFQKWRQTNAGVASLEDDTSSKSKQMSSKDAEMVKSVIIVTCIFLACLSAGHIPAVAVLIIPGTNFGGSQENLFYLTYQMRFLFNVVNSSINFFFYIRMSSRYKTAFATAFPRLSQKIISS